MSRVKLIPLSSGAKEPLPGRSWKELVTADEDLHREWIERGMKVGFPLAENGVSAVDFDDKQAAREWWMKHGELVAVAVETRRGVHCFYSGQTQTRKFAAGDIKGNGYTVFPPSQVNGWTYRFIRDNWDELKPFPESLFPVESRRELTRGRVRDALKYVERVEAVSGQRGHNATFRAACILRDAQIDEVTALAVMVEWNRTNAKPPWETKDLLKKVRDAYRKGSHVPANKS